MSMAPLKKWKWYGFDLDGTIADNTNHAFGYGNIGRPVKPMCNLMKRLHRKGMDVRIFTARLGDVGKTKKAQNALREHIWEWCDRNLGFRPAIVDRKDAAMEAIYDDRAKQVVRNRGYCYEDLNRKLIECLEEAMRRRAVAKDREFCQRCRRVIGKCQPK